MRKGAGANTVAHGSGTVSIEFCGIQKLTLLDYPGHTACTVFTGGCNFRCLFCHNASLVVHPGTELKISGEEIFDFLSNRKGLLDGVCISGGEPTLQGGLRDFARRIKDMGFLVKLDTNGSRPNVLEDMIGSGLVDYVAMDIKTSPERYEAVTGGCSNILDIYESVSLLMESGIDYEFRTTCVHELHKEKDFRSIGEMISGARAYFLQKFVDSGDLIVGGLTECSDEEMHRFREIAAEYVPAVQIRGM